MNKPEVREALFDVAMVLVNQGDRTLGMKIAFLVNELRSRRPIRRAPATSSHVDDAIRDQVHRDSIMYPDSSYIELGKKHNINPGRVSEILAGVRP